jgi:hypothetical protein
LSALAAGRQVGAVITQHIRFLDLKARLAYYEPCKPSNPPNSLLDCNDAKRGLEPPAERRARERRRNRPKR